MTPVADDDRLFLEVSRRYPARPMVCAMYLALDGAPDARALAARLASVVAAHPRLAWSLDGASWIAGAAAPTVETLALPAVADDAAFVAHAAAAMRERLPERAPPWRVQLVRHAGGHGLWLRWHHTLSDGEGMLDLVSALVDGNDDLARVPAACLGDRKPTATKGEAPGVAAFLARLATRRRHGASPSRRQRGPGSDRFVVADVPLGLSHDALVATAARHGATTNDVCVALSVRAMARAGGDGRSLLSPVSARRPGSVELGNRSFALRLDLPDDAAAMPFGALVETVAARAAASLAGATAVPYWFYRLVFRLPDRVLDRALAAAPPFICNYLPWSRAPVAVAGAPVRALHGFTPMLPFHGCTFAFTSYAGRVTGALASDAALLEGRDALAAALAEAARTLVEDLEAHGGAALRAARQGAT